MCQISPFRGRKWVGFHLCLKPLDQHNLLPGLEAHQRAAPDPDGWFELFSPQAGDQRVGLVDLEFMVWGISRATARGYPTDCLTLPL